MCVLLVVALFIAALAGCGDESNGPSKHERFRNTQSNPIPLGNAGGVGGGWRLTVTSVTRNAVSFVGSQRRRPAKAREFRVVVAAKYAGVGRSPLRSLLKRTYVLGSHQVAYQADGGDLNCARRMPQEPSRTPRPLNQRPGMKVSSGATVKGHLCFAVAANDAKALVLFVHPPGCRLNSCAKHVWFSLRK